MADSTRREFVTKAAWITPAILTLPANASFAQAGSSSHPEKKDKEQWHKKLK